MAQGRPERSSGAPKDRPEEARAVLGRSSGLTATVFSKTLRFFIRFFASAARKSANTPLFGIRGKAPVRQIHIFLMFFDDFQDAGVFERAASGSLFEGLGRSSGLLGASQGALMGHPWGAWGPLEGPWEHLGGPQGDLWEASGVLGASSGCPWGPLGRSRGHLEIIEKPLVFVCFLRSGGSRGGPGEAREVLG